MTYLYRRDDGTEFEFVQSMKDEPLEKCPETGQNVERIIPKRRHMFGFHKDHDGSKYMEWSP